VISHDYGDCDVRLVAYVAPAAAAAAPGDTKLETALRKRAAAHLPDYMRPSTYVVLAELPLTVHGKIDLAALPPPDLAAPSAAGQAQAPLSEEQAWVLHVWREQLGLKGIGLEDDFFDFGGTSLALVRAIAAIKSHYQIDLDMGVLAKRGTAGALADVIRSKRS
jgi:syringomycin synthetase protein SyrB1